MKSLFQKFFILILFIISLSPLDSYSLEEEKKNEEVAINNACSATETIYAEMHLNDLVDLSVFEKAYIGYLKLNAKNKNILSIIDFDQPSNEKRLLVLDIKHKKILFHSYVAHGRNSGNLYADSFSNKQGSHKSSLGFYVTENTYQGRNGYSLILNGLEKGINDQAKARAIVIHGADYCSENVIASSGRLGRSFGCPAIPRELTEPIINTIKNGSLLFIHASNRSYLAQSKILLPENHFSNLGNSL